MDNVQMKKLPKSQVHFEISLPEQHVLALLPEASGLMSQKIEIKGFRKGKVPQDVLEKHVGKERLFEEASYLAIDKAYKMLFKEHALNPVGQPKVEIKKLAAGNPLEFSITVPVHPDVTLPDYRAIAEKARMEKKSPEVKKEEIAETIEYVRKSRRKEVLVAREAKTGDLVELDFEARIAGVKLDGGESRNHPLILGESKFIPGFEENITGMKAGEEKTFSVTVPKDYYQEQLREKILDFKVKINGVYELALPELNDEFAKSLGAFETLVALEESVKENIAKDKETKEVERVRRVFAEELAVKATIDVPDMLVDQEVDTMIAEMRQNIEREGANFDSYLMGIKKTTDDLKKEFRKQADTRVRIALCLKEIAKQENITLDDKDVQAQASQVLARYDEAERSRIDKTLLAQYVSGIMKNEKIFTLLEL